MSPYTIKIFFSNVNQLCCLTQFYSTAPSCVCVSYCETITLMFYIRVLIYFICLFFVCL